MTPKPPPRILITVPNGAEEIEMITVADLLVRGGCEVTLAGVDTLTPTGSRDLPLRADVLLAEVSQDSWDAVYLPGGLPAAEAHSTNNLVQQLITERLQQQTWLAIICASPKALLPANLAHGRTLTSFPALRETMENGGAQWHDKAVVRDNSLLTSQGPGTAAALGLALIALLTDNDNAANVASAALLDGAWHDAQQAL